MSDLHIDPMRLTLFFLSFVVMAQLVTWLNKRKQELDVKVAVLPAVITELFADLGMFAHSIGLLILPFVGFSYMVLVRLKIQHYFIVGTLIAVTALFFGAGQFIENTIRFGTPIHDAEPIWDLARIDHKNDVRYRRELVTVSQRVFNGMLGWFSQPSIYGYIHWLVLFPGIFFFGISGK